MKLDFFNRFSKNTQTSNFMKIPSVGAKLFHVYRRTKTDRETRWNQQSLFAICECI